MPEEAENLEETNVENSGENKKSDLRDSSSSPLKDGVSKAANNIIDFNEHKGRRNKKPIVSSTSSKNNADNNIVQFPSKKSVNPSNNLKRNATNAMLNKASNLHPALKALNTARNVIGGRRNNVGGVFGAGTNSTQDEGTDTKEDNTTNKNNSNSTSSSANNTANNVDNDTTSNEGSSSFNPLSSLLGSDGLAGRFSFFGRLPMPLKLILIIGVPLFGLFIILAPFIIIFSFFSGLFGADNSLASGGGSGNIDYGDYELVSDGHSILHESLDTFLASNGTSLEEFNALIASNVEDAGYGTRAGVVASAVTLIAELGNNYDVKIPYFWGGGHGAMFDGAQANWGSTQCHAYANGRSYNYCGLDCSGFVAWAIWNGGFNVAARTAGSFQNLPGAEHVSLTSSAVLQPGDLLESGSHVILVVGIDEEAGEYICAEASGLESGVTFSRKAFNNQNYWGVNMEGFYNREGQARS